VGVAWRGTQKGTETLSEHQRLRNRRNNPETGKNARGEGRLEWLVLQRHFSIPDWPGSDRNAVKKARNPIETNSLSRCKSLQQVSFESNSRLTRIESHAFSNSSLHSILIPRDVRLTDGSAFHSIPKCEAIINFDRKLE
jgi:hypothetical protein